MPRIPSGKMGSLSILMKDEFIGRFLRFAICSRGDCNPIKITSATSDSPNPTESRCVEKPQEKVAIKILLPSDIAMSDEFFNNLRFAAWFHCQ
jgi:hypothetical protein